MLLSAVSVLVVEQSIFEIPEGLLNNPVLSVEKWQMEWDRSTKGQITKQYFPTIADILNITIN